MSLLRHSFRAMGTDCGLVVSAAPSDTAMAHRAIGAALTELSALERALSRFDASSGLSHLNAASGSWVEVDERLFHAVKAAVEARETTDGRFDPTVLPALIAAGYDRTFAELQPRDAGSLGRLERGRGDRSRPGRAQDSSRPRHQDRSRWDRQGAVGDGSPGHDAHDLAPDAGCPRRPRRRHRRRRSGTGRSLADRGRRSPHAGWTAWRAGADRRRCGHIRPRPPPVRPRSIPAPPDRPCHRAVPRRPARSVSRWSLRPRPRPRCTQPRSRSRPCEQSQAYVDQHPGLSALVVPATDPPFTCGRIPLVERDAEVVEAA